MLRACNVHVAASGEKLMQSKQIKAWALASTLLSGLAVSAPAIAQDEEAGEDTIVVTGSRLNTNPNLAAATPVLSVTGEEVDIRGNVRIEDFVNILPQVFAGQAGEVSNGATGTATLNLRNLGATRTLVLIDGRRLPYGDSTSSAANLDLIPSQLVERVDILTGGASAVYGSDAVGGVANFILKRDFEGVEFGLQSGISNAPNGHDLFDAVAEAAGQPVADEAWDGEETLAHIIMGVNTPDGRGNVTLFASYERREEITQDDRSISACALGQSQGSTSVGGYGCIGSANFRLFGGPGGFTFQEANGDLVPWAGTSDQTFNFGPFNFFLRPSERYQLNAKGYYALTDNIEAFADFSYTNNTSDAQIAPTASFGIGSYSINCDNPYIQGSALLDTFGCTAADIAAGTIATGLTASHRNVEGGPRNSYLENLAWRMVGGLRGNVAEHWDWQLFAQMSETRDMNRSTNDFVVANLQQAFLAVDDGSGNVVCIDQSGGCVPYNPFQRGTDGSTMITQDQIDFLHGVGITTGETSQFVMGGDIQADLGNYGLSSPWSDAGVGFLAGFEYREDTLEATPDEISQIPGGGFTGVGGATLPVAGKVEVSEIFSEVQVPIITGVELIEELTFSGQYRYSDYSVDGNGVTNSFSTDAYGAQLAWAPTSDVRVRAQFQRAVRAPNVIELFTGQNTGLPDLSAAGTNANGVQLFDPCASDAPIASLDACANTGVTAAQYGTILDVISGQTQSITGGNPLLDPEVSDTLTFGAVFTPEAVPGLSVSLDYFDITVEDFIAAGISAQTVLDECLATGEATFCDLITRSSSGSVAAGPAGVGFQQTNINIAELSTSGLDLQVVYGFDLEDVSASLADFGSVRVDYAATFLDSYDFVNFPGADVDECAGFFGNTCGTPVAEYRHRLLTTWESPWDFEVTATWRHTSGVDNDNEADDLETTIAPIGYLDLSGNWQLNDTLNLRGGVLNVFAEQAPVFTAAGTGTGNGNTYPTVYDTSRYFFAGVTANF
jgi:outer membrane receptor protein involved in Fe transport